ncbi:MAG: transposase [Methylococcales bacterium]|nr:transposase [Methylococcales bacterium]
MADKGYDTNALREWLKEQGIKAVIPPKSNRKEQIVCGLSPL